MIKHIETEAKFTWLYSKGEGQQDYMFHYVLLYMSTFLHNIQDRGTHTHTQKKTIISDFQQATHWPAYLVSLIISVEWATLLAACCSGSWRVIRLRYKNSQLRTSRKAVRDIITGLYRIWSKRPNNKVTSFPRNNRNSPSSSLYSCA